MIRRLVVAAFVVVGSIAVAPAAQADGAFHAPCTRFPGPFPDATGGEIIITPHGNINANCRYPGPAEGGGADVTTYEGCVITPAGNFQCNPGSPQA